MIDGTNLECPTPSVATVGEQAMEKSDVKSPVGDVGVDKEKNQGIFGPWMLSSRKAKKKGPVKRVSTAIIGKPNDKKKDGMCG